MPVIDAHTHIRRDRGFTPARFFAGQLGGTVDPDEVFAREASQARLDPDGSKALAMMEKCGVDIVCTCPVDYAYILGEAECSIEEMNEWYPELQKMHPGKFIFFAGVDPRRPNAVEIFKKALDQGAKGLKLHPTTGFLPNDEACQPLYRLASEYGAVILYHTGPSWMKARFAHPFYVDDVAAAYPDMKILLGHTGLVWWREALQVIRTKRNCYAELALWQFRLRMNKPQWVKDVAEVRDAVSAERMVYGTDWPAGQPDISDFTNAIRDLPELGKEYGLTFTKDETDAILGNNMAKLLGI